MILIISIITMLTDIMLFWKFTVFRNSTINDLDYIIEYIELYTNTEEINKDMVLSRVSVFDIDQIQEKRIIVKRNMVNLDPKLIEGSIKYLDNNECGKIELWNPYLPMTQVVLKDPIINKNNIKRIGFINNCSVFKYIGYRVPITDFYNDLIDNVESSKDDELFTIVNIILISYRYGGYIVSIDLDIEYDISFNDISYIYYSGKENKIMGLKFPRKSYILWLLMCEISEKKDIKYTEILNILKKKISEYYQVVDINSTISYQDVNLLEDAYQKISFIDVDEYDKPIKESKININDIYCLL